MRGDDVASTIQQSLMVGVFPTLGWQLRTRLSTALQVGFARK
jgi:hypothetical protein